MVRAGLECDVDRPAPRPPASRRECEHLGVRLALPLVPPLADQLAAADDDRTYGRVRMRRPSPPLCELDRTLKEVRVHVVDPTAD